ncbi:MAG: hypothetical protein GY732_13365 [Gammaproteobacteria bacterium]|nr:hypothetical protein [Gammaproteobacteria bacterium]
MMSYIVLSIIEAGVYRLDAFLETIHFELRIAVVAVEGPHPGMASIRNENMKSL